MRDGLFISLFAVLLFALSTPALAGAPPECETDEQCQEWGYETCGVMGCEGGEAMDNHTEWEPPPGPDACSSDADCPEGQSCAMNPDASVGACIDSPSSSEDADAASESAEEGASADEGGEGTDEEVSSGCQGSQTPAGLALFALGLIGLAMRSRRLGLER
ncbi:MAG: hypothetical protein ACPGU1_22370 [Myxococcota bacterium]